MREQLKIALEVAILVVLVGWVVSQFIQPPRVVAPASSELLGREVKTCGELGREIEDMTQTTAELRKVLRDLQVVVCAGK